MSVKLEGPLTKWTNVVQGWQYRWFVLDEYTGLLSYYTSKDKMMRGARRGCLRLKGGKIGINDEDDCTFTITCDHRTFHFQAQNSEERFKWIKGLEEVIANHLPGTTVNSGFVIPTEEELNRRMMEAEAYFRILTQQVKKVEAKINHSTAPKSERSLMLKDSLTQMIETIGQTIELLHDAKTSLAKKVPVPVISNKSSSDTSSPVILSPKTTSGESESGSSSARSVLSTPRSDDTSSRTDLSEQQDLQAIVSETSSADSKVEEAVEETEKGAEEDSSQHAKHEEFVNITAPPAVSPIVPISSYTSSDEEDIDEFFDAHDEITIEEIEQSLKEEEENLFKTKHKESHLIDLNQVEKAEKEAVSASSGASADAKSSEPPTQAVKKLSLGDDYDNEDNDDDDDGNEDMAQHGSVITHLLSQVRIGMDLTKVTLPTFILERRSLLEMYADFFAHPDLFKGIPDLKDPGDRMVQVLKWYLSSFHAGRKGSVAKKPYNPILGEIFQCFYDLTDDTSLRANPDELSKSGPIPWCTKDDVSFIAEQVSHHPPISAFYAECEKKRVCFNSHLWTKSKFLGLSIGVHIVGTGNVFVSDYDEEYIMTFPNGYGRSILTVPWVELGGKTEITCPKSGYSVQLDFLTKPFYGGKRNRITAEVFAPNQKKAFMSVHGEWNGVMYAKYTHQKFPKYDGPQPGKGRFQDVGAKVQEPEIFVDTFNMGTVNKNVKKVSLQEDHESRRMWEFVTQNLKANNIEKATEGKHSLEEKQRQDARVRKETNTKWVTRLFDEWNEGEDRKFFYKWPLYKRQGLSKPGENMVALS